MADDLLNILLSGKSEKLLSRLDAIGVGDQARKIALNAVHGVTELSLKGFKSKTPIDTLELRGQGLDTGLIRMSVPTLGNGIKGSVYVANAIHYGADGKPYNAIELSDLLDSSAGGFRTRASAPIDGFGSEAKRSPTADWKGKAERAIRRQLGSYLRSTDFTNGF